MGIIAMNPINVFATKAIGLYKTRVIPPQKCQPATTQLMRLRAIAGILRPKRFVNPSTKRKIAG